MAYSGQIPTAGPMTAEALTEDINEELEELYARAPHAALSIGGTANMITGTLFPVPLNYSKARLVIFKPAQANTGAVQVNWGFGAVSLRDGLGQELDDADLSASVYYMAIYDEVNSRYQIAGLYDNTIGGGIDFMNSLLTRPVLDNYSVRVQSPAITSGVLVLDFVNGNVANVLLDQDVTSIIINNWPPGTRERTMVLYTTQDVTGGWFVDFDVPGWRWVNSIVPIPTLTPGKTDCWVLKSLNGGTDVLATPAGQNY